MSKDYYRPVRTGARYTNDLRGSSVRVESVLPDEVHFRSEETNSLYSCSITSFNAMYSEDSGSGGVTLFILFIITAVVYVLFIK